MSELWMPKFLDVHPMKGFDEETLRKWTLPAPLDEFDVKPENMFYNKEQDRFFCLLDAPNKEAIEKHHAEFGLKCEWITEVERTAQAEYRETENYKTLLKEWALLLNHLSLESRGKLLRATTEYPCSEDNE